MHRGRQVSQQRGLDIVSSSPVRCIWLEQTPRPIPRELDRGEIYTIMDHYALIAAHAKCNGYDMVKIHGGHGYLVNSFMSPYLNKRTDEFGGNIENRMRFPLELIRRIKKDVGDEFPIGFRLSGDEFIEGGGNHR
jgi:2,4-dienoyl-CoA reductase-like NADH-dependent reductase (Old Yellow Enzyme family)